MTTADYVAQNVTTANLALVCTVYFPTETPLPDVQRRMDAMARRLGANRAIFRVEGSQWRCDAYDDPNQIWYHGKR